MIDWQPDYPGDQRLVAVAAEIAVMSAGANRSGRTDGRDESGRFPWSAWVYAGPRRGGYASTLDEAKACAIAAAREILTAALAALD